MWPTAPLLDASTPTRLGCGPANREAEEQAQFPAQRAQKAQTFFDEDIGVDAARPQREWELQLQRVILRHGVV
jgi:hypothetical protein